MKKIAVFCLLHFFVTIVFAQKQTYDLVSYTPPAGWKKEVQNNTTSYNH